MTKIIHAIISLKYLKILFFLFTEPSNNSQKVGVTFRKSKIVYTAGYSERSQFQYLYYYTWFDLLL